ncbi:MAG: hypothetical protein P4L51_01890 [Puia sp.]|nr:hypothetical protein [Puia sp.]
MELEEKAYAEIETILKEKGFVELLPTLDCYPPQISTDFFQNAVEFIYVDGDDRREFAAVESIQLKEGILLFNGILLGRSYPSKVTVGSDDLTIFEFLCSADKLIEMAGL